MPSSAFLYAVLAIILAVVSAAVLAAVCLWIRLFRSRARLNGRMTLPGVGAPITLERDAAGIPTVSGSSRADVGFGLGFLHAQERYFQMDLARRAAAGERAELLGKSLVTADQKARPHLFRKRAEQICAALDGDQKDLLSSYTAGVRAGLHALSAPPVEYLLLRSQPAEWRLEDTLLVVFNFYRLLQDERADQAFNRHLLCTALPRRVADFLAPEGSPDWDAPLVGPILPAPPLPGPDLIDLRHTHPQRLPSLRLRPSPVGGSNAWALAGLHTAHGTAIVANDLHLPFEMPPIFYRATLVVGGQSATRLSGITMPGFPFLLAGSNGDVAWGLANAAMRAVDLIRLDQEHCPPDAYRTADGVKAFDTTSEPIRVRGGADATVTIRSTPWGPITRKTRDGVLFAQSWLAHDPAAVNLAWHALETATSVSEALDAANRIGTPTLALIAGDSRGRVGWTLAGLLPRRLKDAGRIAESSAELPHQPPRTPRMRHPQLQSPDVTRVWAANARSITGGEFAGLMDGGYHACGARATQIRDSLLGLGLADEESMLRIQCDDRALFLSRWHSLLLDVLSDPQRLVHHRRAEARAALVAWNGRAAVDSIAYRLLRRFHDITELLVFEPFVSLVRARHGQFDLASVTDQLETPVWHLISERPAHLLPPWFSDWDELVAQAARQVLNEIRTGAPLRSHVWGAANQLGMRHVLSPLIPWLGRLWQVPRSALGGDLNVPLAQTSQHGPVVRLVMSPGRNDTAIAQMAGGQTSNRLSPYYLAGHHEWLRGTETPLEPGPTRYALTLEPIRT